MSVTFRPAIITEWSHILPVDILINGAYELLNHNQPEVVTKDQINGVIIEMSEENKLIIENDNCFTFTLLFRSEKCANHS